MPLPTCSRKCWEFRVRHRPSAGLVLSVSPLLSSAGGVVFLRRSRGQLVFPGSQLAQGSVFRDGPTPDDGTRAALTSDLLPPAGGGSEAREAPEAARPSMRLERSPHQPRSPGSVRRGVGGGGNRRHRAAGPPPGTRVTRCPPAARGLPSRGDFGGSRGSRSPKPGGAHRAQFRRRPGGGAGAADQVTERRSRLREAAWFSAAAAAAAVTAAVATPSGGAGKGGPAGWGGGTGVESAAGGGGRAAGGRAEASAAAAVSRRGWARGMGAPR
ncbi:hypothetical protein ACRRTK_024084 [Alexandromys fortis]